MDPDQLHQFKTMNCEDRRCPLRCTNKFIREAPQIEVSYNLSIWGVSTFMMIRIEEDPRENHHITHSTPTIASK